MGVIIIGMISSITLISEESKTDRYDELTKMTSAAVRQTVKESQQLGSVITSEDGMANYFITTLCSTLKCDGDIEVKIMGSNYKEGMLDVVVVETFLYPTGKKGTVKVRKCAIYN